MPDHASPPRWAYWGAVAGLLLLAGLGLAAAWELRPEPREAPTACHCEHVESLLPKPSRSPIKSVCWCSEHERWESYEDAKREANGR